MKVRLEHFHLILVPIMLVVSSCSPFGGTSFIDFFSAPKVLEIDDKGATSSLRQSEIIEWNVSGTELEKILSFEISLGSVAGATDVVPWTDVGLINSYVFNQRFLPSTTYYVGLRFIDKDTHVKSPTFTSRGFTTPPNAVEKIVPGAYHTCALTQTGEVKCWGANYYGELGYGDTTTRGGINGEVAALGFVDLGPGLLALDVVVGAWHSCALLSNEQVKCWGANWNGQLGYEDGLNRGDTPSSMSTLESINLGYGRLVKGISAGYDHTCALLDNGAVKCWGGNSSGQLGYDITGTMYATTAGVPSLAEVDLGAGQIATQIFAGGGTTCALLFGGAVKCWGENSTGQLGQDDNAIRGASLSSMAALDEIDLGFGRSAISLAVGQSHVCALLDTAKVKCWGSNWSGQLGYDDAINRGDVVGSMGTLTEIDFGATEDVQSIVAGLGHTCAVFAGGALRCWGYNYEGQLGYGDNVARGHVLGSINSLGPVDFKDGVKIRQVNAGGSNTCAVDVHDRVKCWGPNSFGQLGLGDLVARGQSKSVFELPPVNLGPGRTLKTLSTGANHACAILDNNDLKCWGNNGYGQLGYDDLTGRGGDPGSMAALAPVNVGSGRHAKKVSAGFSHTCAILDDDTVKCWGANNFGQAGYERSDSFFGHSPGSMASLPIVHLGVGRTAKEIVAGRGTTCAILDDDNVKCWGWNNSGQLGQDNTIDRGLSNGDMTTLAAVNVGPARTAKAIAIGASHVCVILDDDRVKCWGANSYGQLGQDDTTYRGGPYGFMSSLSSIDLGIGRTAKSLMADGDFTCVILDNDQTKCFGNNNVGQLGMDDTVGRGGTAGSMAALGAIDLGVGRYAESIEMGYAHVCVILDNDRIKCWGFNHAGQLGLNDMLYRGDAPGSMALATEVYLGPARSVKSISAGRNFSCVHMDNDQLKCWGANENGQLGQDNLVNYGASTSVAETPFVPVIP